MQMKLLVTVLFLLGTGFLHAQYYFSGKLDSSAAGKTVYLSLIQDYRKISRPYSDQIIHKAMAGPAGEFEFRGDNLNSKNRIYRIHVEECEDGGSETGHFLKGCNAYRSVLFLARNQDTLGFPETLGGEVLCSIQSTNANSTDLLEVDALKEQMILDFTEVPSAASRELNLNKWFLLWKDYGKAAEEPLTELYIYAFLSDRGSETHDYYLKDLVGSSYYVELAESLEKGYSNATFTRIYRSEIQADLNVMQGATAPAAKLPWILLCLLSISVFINFYFIRKKGVNKPQKRFTKAEDNLTQQEKAVLHEILEGRSNKEIAAALFISLSTVKSHINSIYKKLGVSSRKDLKTHFRD